MVDQLQGGNTEYIEELLRANYVDDFYSMEITLGDNRASEQDRRTTLSFTKDQLLNGGNGFTKRNNRYIRL